MDIGKLQEWVGKQQSMEERIASFPANALAATLDRDDPPYEDGETLPPLWHWLHFLPVFKLAHTGHDGHLGLGGFMPPVPLPRRMWAGSRLQFLAPVVIGRSLRKVTTIKSVAHKSGRSGELVFVTLRHQVFDGAAQAIEEEQDIVYREAARPGEQAGAPPAAPQEDSFSRTLVPDPVLLFRYSALTFNGHRIHYDHPFCTGTEGYDGLVVHGPLLATLMLDLLRRQFPQARLATYGFRAVSPVFDTHPFSVHGSVDAGGNKVRLWVKRHDGALAMSADAVLG